MWMNTQQNPTTPIKERINHLYEIILSIGDIIIKSFPYNMQQKTLVKLFEKIFNFLKLYPDFPDKSL